MEVSSFGAELGLWKLVYPLGRVRVSFESFCYRLSLRLGETQLSYFEGKKKHGRSHVSHISRIFTVNNASSRASARTPLKLAPIIYSLNVINNETRLYASRNVREITPTRRREQTISHVSRTPVQFREKLAKTERPRAHKYPHERSHRAVARSEGKKRHGLLGGAERAKRL